MVVNIVIIINININMRMDFELDLKMYNGAKEGFYVGKIVGGGLVEMNE
jgi:hypothetical protein